MSPPRCCSTALARVFWEQPSVRYYSHEPFEEVYYRGRELNHAIGRLQDPLDLCTVYKDQGTSSGFVIKEMPYQIGNCAESLLAIATKPVVFLIRDPRLSIQSRISKKSEVAQSILFPQTETG